MNLLSVTVTGTTPQDRTFWLSQKRTLLKEIKGLQASMQQAAKEEKIWHVVAESIAHGEGGTKNRQKDMETFNDCLQRSEKCKQAIQKALNAYRENCRRLSEINFHIRQFGAEIAENHLNSSMFTKIIDALHLGNLVRRHI